MYGIVVYTGSETKIKQNHHEKTNLKKSMMEQKMSNLVMMLFIFQFFLSAIGAMLSQVFDEHNVNTSYYLSI